MTKKNLERRYKYLLPQMKQIRELLNNDENLTDDKLFRTLGRIDYITDPSIMDQRMRYLEKEDREYDFFNKSRQES